MGRRPAQPLQGWRSRALRAHSLALPFAFAARRRGPFAWGLFETTRGGRLLRAGPSAPRRRRCSRRARARPPARGAGPLLERPRAPLLLNLPLRPPAKAQAAGGGRGGRPPAERVQRERAGCFTPSPPGPGRRPTQRRSTACSPTSCHLLPNGAGRAGRRRGAGAPARIPVCTKAAAAAHLLHWKKWPSPRAPLL